MRPSNLESLKLEISLKAKNGINFIVAASIVWFIIAIVWTMPYSSYDKSVFTFITGSFMLPLALLFSKLFKTQWKIENNPLQPLGLWLNFAQLFYFPFLILILIRQPDYFVMTYAVITGAHFFPYAWFYNEKSYAFAAGIISLGSLFIALSVSPEQMYLIPVFMGTCLAVLSGLLFLSYKKKAELSLKPMRAK